VPHLDPRIALLLDALDRAFDRKGWHGTTLRGALRGLAVETALFRPAPGRHNAWELLLHAAYWKYAVRRRLAGGAHNSFPRKPSNWPALPSPADGAALARDLALLGEEHERLREAVAAFPPGRLDEPIGKPWTPAQLIQGATAHDLYHTGQIQLLKRLAGAAVAILVTTLS
jgi:uncharacterized damage-inducible protein DinB